MLYSPGMKINLPVPDFFERFKSVTELLEKYNAPHTIAILAGGIDTEPEWVEYIKAHKFDIQLHGLIHLDATQTHDYLKDNLKKAVEKIVQTFGVMPTVWYPPWNRVDDYVLSVAHDLGLTVSYEKISLSNFISHPVRDAVINFHYWAEEDTKDLEKALIKAKELCLI